MGDARETERVTLQKKKKKKEDKIGMKVMGMIKFVYARCRYPQTDAGALWLTKTSQEIWGFLADE